MTGINQKYRSFYHELSEIYPPGEAEEMTSLVFEEVFQMNRFLLKIKNREISQAENEYLHAILARLLKQEPVQYILEFAWFMGHRYKINKDVLIPRSETEELINWINETSDNPTNILDMGTGSGCIAIELKHSFPDAKVSGADISLSALEVAKANAQKILSSGQIDFFQMDILEPNWDCEEKFDLIVSNPPYVTQEEKDAMPINVLDHEPHGALFVPWDQPLLFYDAIADFACQHLSTEGKLFLEINEKKGTETMEMLTKKGFGQIELKQDMQGKDRMIKASF